MTLGYVILQSGCTAQDLAEQLSFDDIIDALKSKTNLELGTYCYRNVPVSLNAPS
jgi:hypothetical protein